MLGSLGLRRGYLMGVHYDWLHAMIAGQKVSILHVEACGNKHILFLISTLLLFKVCIFCGLSSRQVKKVVNGTFLRVTQLCNDCGRKRVWESQPFIGPRQAGNILLSSAILYTGSLPSKALRLFQVLKYATKSCSAFFRHQSEFMWPAINRVWKNQQRVLFSQFKSEKT